MRIFSHSVIAAKSCALNKLFFPEANVIRVSALQLPELSAAAALVLPCNAPALESFCVQSTTALSV
jgi:hypothetical protein